MAGSKIAGTRLRIVDPNNFKNQYAGSMFGDTNYNMSVPLEDLCIIVELKTSTKPRTVLIATAAANTDPTALRVGFNGGAVKFIDGSTNQQTGDQDYLTTNYTNISTELTMIEETLGITNIDIDFNSSYAPMVNIDFIDIKGASVFQMNGESKYNVFFRLPYPIFELTVKGYYGKPVKYCLHMIKCNSRFNSTSGNFEMKAEFVGYTYAMLSDMIAGDLKASERTTRGKELLAQVTPKTSSILEYVKRASLIDKTTHEKILGDDNTPASEDANNLSQVNESIVKIDAMISDIIATITNINSNSERYKVPQVYDNNILLNDAFAVVINPGSDDVDNQTKVTDSNKSLDGLIDDYNKPYIADPASADITISSKNNAHITAIFGLYIELIDTSQGNIDILTHRYDDFTDADAVAEINIRKVALTNASSEAGKLKLYDGFVAIQYLKAIRNSLDTRQKALSEKVATNLQEVVTEQLGVPTDIRSVVNIFTTGVEIFLQQLFEVSARWQEQPRVDEFAKFKNDPKALDVSLRDRAPSVGDPNIYAWPEYSENDTEKYLGAPGVLNNPLAVPEIKFVEDMYDAMVKDAKDEEDIRNKIGQEDQKAKWASFTPYDSSYYNKTETNPYERLLTLTNKNPTHDDIAKLMLLRAIGVLGFSNFYVSPDEAIAFAAAEAALVIKQFDAKLVKALNENYKDTTTYINQKADDDTFNDIAFLNPIPSGWTYNFIYIYKERKVLPITKNFFGDGKEKLDRPLYGNDNATDNEIKNSPLISNVIQYALPDMNDELRGFPDSAKYLDFEKVSDYGGGGGSPISYVYLSKDISSPEDLKNANIQLGNGLYGVQDFRTIDYTDSIYAPVTGLDFFSVFYDNGSLYPDGSKVPTLSPIRDPKITTIYDVKPTYNVPNFIVNNGPLSIGSGEMLLNKLWGERADIGNNILLIQQKQNNTSVVCNWFYFWVAQPTSVDYYFRDKYKGFGYPDGALISLFGSKFYNNQTDLNARAFLFLHSLPWKGLAGRAKNSPTGEVGVFNQKEILNAFQYRSGFVQVPKLWPAFIGALLWRMDETTDPIKWVGTTATDYLLPTFNGINNGNSVFGIGGGNNVPTKTQYFKINTEVGDSIVDDETAEGTYVNASMCFSNSYNSLGYIEIEDTIKTLPYPVRETFKKEFLDFVNNEFKQIRPLINSSTNSTTASWDASWETINNSTTLVKSTTGVDYSTVNLSTVNFNLDLEIGVGNTKKIEDVFTVFSFPAMPAGQFLPPYYLNPWKYNYFVEFKDDNTFIAKATEWFFDKKYIANSSPLMWNTSVKPYALPQYHINAPIILSDTLLKAYFGQIITSLKDEVAAKEKKTHNTNEINDVKLEIYRRYKKIYDKWIAASDNPDAITFQCCYAGTSKKERLAGDTKIATNRGSNSGPKLIDSFRFLTRSFKDIGGEFQINPNIISQLILDNSNISFYDLISRVLSDNNFDFIALPSFIDYNDPKEIESAFTPYPYYEAKNIYAPSGPSFVCMYVGQTSTKLDFGKTSPYPNDGIDLTSPTGTPLLPKDFDSPQADTEDIHAAFVVRYGQQNQNFFKDIILDQAEFNETAESLAITDQISNQYSDTNQSYFGQNIYNIYSVRSYKIEVEMMGDAMIQPMMYFQLENIPMFHGAYLITHVKHSIKPNSMSTNFVGTRIKATETKIMDAATMYNGLLNSYELKAATGKFTNRTSGSFAPIVATIVQNGGANGNPAQGSITFKPIPKIDGVNNTKINEPDNRDSMITEATNALVAMLNAYVAFAKANNYPKVGNDYVGIISLFRGFAYQKDLYEAEQKKSPGSKAVAEPGKSNHGWGITVDLYFPLSSGKGWYPNHAEPTVKSPGFDYDENKAFAWFFDNSANYGFLIPQLLRKGYGQDEYWHFEYHGTVALCLLSKLPILKYTHGGVETSHSVDLTTITVDPAIVINPIDPATKAPAIYYTVKCDDIRVSYSEEGVAGAKSTTAGELSWQLENQVQVKDYLKAKGYTPQIVAGIMGNMFAECAFDACADGGDTKGRSYGLVMWNTKSYPIQYETELRVGCTRNSGSETSPRNASKQLKTNQKDIIQLQMDYLMTNPAYKTFITEANATANLDASNAAYLFAKIFEVCSYCNKTYQKYLTGGYVTIEGQQIFIKPAVRSEYANDIIARLANPNDKIYWGSDFGYVPPSPANAAINNSNPNTGPTPNDIMIGDSIVGVITTAIKAIGGKSTYISSTPGEASLWQGGTSLNGFLLPALKKYGTNNNIESVVVSTGTNSGFNPADKVEELIGELKAKFPKAASNNKIYFIKGSWGWGGNTGADYPDLRIVLPNNTNPPYGDPQKITTYYNRFVAKGILEIKPAIGFCTDAQGHNPAYSTNVLIAADIKSKIG